MSEPAELRLVVDRETGEVSESSCPECATAAQDVENITKELRKALRRERELRADREKEAELHPQRGEIVEVFEFWQAECRHPNAKLDADRTFAIAGMLKRYGLEICKRAVRGAAFDPFTAPRKNGSVQRFDGVDLIFRNSEKLENFANKAPR